MQNSLAADRDRRFATLALMAVLLLGAMILRVWSINKESFWADEGWTMVLSRGPSLSDVVTTMANDQPPPLYFALFHYWTLLAGNSEFVARLFSAFWSLLGVALIYRLGRDLFNPAAGIFGALILALADNDIMMAQETRHYTQMATLAVLSAVFYFRYLRHSRRIDGIGWLLSSIALMYTHYLGAFILLVQLLHILICARPLRRLLDLLFRWVLIGVGWLPWALVFINQSLVRYTRPILFRSSLPNTPETFVTVRGDLFGAHFGLMFGLLLLGLLYVRYRDGFPIVRIRPIAPTIYLLLWFALPILLIVLINTRYEILTPRNFLLITPVIALLIGHGLTNLDRTARTFLVIVIVVVNLTTVDAYFIKPPWRQVAKDILDYRLADEPVLMDVWVDDFALRYHIGRDLGIDPVTLPLISIPEWLEKYKDAFYVRLLDYVNSKNAVWMADWSKDEDGVLQLLQSHGFVRTATQIETHLETNLIRIYRYDRVPTSSPLAIFADKLALMRTQFDSTVARGGRLPVALWWSVQANLGLDYSTSVFLLDSNGVLVAQHDGSSLDGKSPMHEWQAGDLRFDRPAIPIPANLPPGEYRIGLKVYWYADPKPLLIVGLQNEYAVLGTVTIH